MQALILAYLSREPPLLWPRRGNPRSGDRFLPQPVQASRERHNCFFPTSQAPGATLPVALKMGLTRACSQSLSRQRFAPKGISCGPERGRERQREGNKNAPFSPGQDIRRRSHWLIGGGSRGGVPFFVPSSLRGEPVKLAFGPFRTNGPDERPRLVISKRISWALPTCMRNHPKTSAFEPVTFEIEGLLDSRVEKDTGPPPPEARPSPCLMRPPFLRANPWPPLVHGICYWPAREILQHKTGVVL